MKSRVSISLDLDGTLTKSRFVDSVWLEGLPEMVAESLNIGFLAAQQMCREAYSNAGDDALVWYRLDYWLDYFGLGGVEPKSFISGYADRITLFHDVLPVLEELVSNEYPLILFSNAARDFLDLEVSEGNLASYFNAVISVTDDWGMVKSDPQAFIRLKRMVPGDLVHAGDHLKFDYEVPTSVGIRSFHICRDHGVRTESSLPDLFSFSDMIYRYYP